MKQIENNEMNEGNRMRLINLPDDSSAILNFGINETKDVAAIYFKGWEAGIKSLNDGVLDFTDLVNLLPLALALPAAFIGANLIPEELKNLSSTEIEELMSTSNEYELGNSAPIARQILRLILNLIKTYNVVQNG